MDATVSSSSIAKNITMNVRVTGVRRWRLRLWLGVWLIKLGARVIGVGVNVETASSLPPPCRGGGYGPPRPTPPPPVARRTNS